MFYSWDTASLFMFMVISFKKKISFPFSQFREMAPEIEEYEAERQGDCDLIRSDGAWWDRTWLT